MTRNELDQFDITPQAGSGELSLQRSEKSRPYPSGEPTTIVQHVHPAAAVCHSVPMAVGEESQIAPLTADIDDVATRLETVADTIEASLKHDTSEKFKDRIRDWSQSHEFDRPFKIAARYAVLSSVLKAALYEWYTHRGDLPRKNGELKDAFAEGADQTGNCAFDESLLDEIVWRAPGDAVAELSWWRYGILTAEGPSDDFGYLFETLIPGDERGKHGQYRTSPRISAIMRELAISDGDCVLDAGMGAGALSVTADQTASVTTYGIEQSRLGVLMAVTALALEEQRGIVHEADFFDVSPVTLGMEPDAAIGDGYGPRQPDILPGEVDVAIGNPPYVANRDLSRDTSHYRQHLRAFGVDDRTPYLDGDRKISGRSDLFCYFLTHATRFLREGGQLVYLLPTKWMETQYGETLQEFLFGHYSLSAVLRFEDDVFDDVAVNAVVVVAERCDDATARRNATTRFITLSDDLNPATIDDLVTGDHSESADVDEEENEDSRADSGFQVVTTRQGELADRDTSDGPLTQYFQDCAPLQSLQQAETLTPLRALASVSYGQRTGNNDLFLLDSSDLDSWPIADRFHRPALDDFGTVDGYRLTTENSDVSMLDVHEFVESQRGVRSELSRAQQVRHALERDGYDTLLEYLDQCEDLHDEASVDADSEVRFDQGELDAPQFVHPYRVHSDVRILRNPDDVVPTNCANGIDVTPGVDAVALLAYLNSTLHAAFLELWGQSEGGGSLEITTTTLRQMPVADVREFSEPARTAVVTAYRALVRGEEDAQIQLDTAVLDAIDAEFDAESLRVMRESLMQDRLSHS